MILCSLENLSGTLNLRAVIMCDISTRPVATLTINSDGTRNVHVNSAPKKGDRILSFMQKIEFSEKIAEILDEGFHFFEPILKYVCSLRVYEELGDLHHTMHKFEHTLHAFCLLKDITLIFNGRFIVYRKNDKLDMAATASRVCHLAAHLFSTIYYISSFGVKRLDVIAKVNKFSPLIAGIGYFITFYTLIAHAKSKKHHFNCSKTAFHGGGFVFGIASFAKHLPSFKNYAFLITKIAALAGIIHAWAFLHEESKTEQVFKNVKDESAPAT